MKKEKKTSSKPENDNSVIRLRHNRFDGFDVYSVEMNGRKTLFHKEVLPKPFIVGGVFKVLGANGNLWLCENIETKQIHIGPDQSFENIIAEQKLASPSTSSASQ
jgi:hypothetical protein